MKASAIVLARTIFAAGTQGLGWIEVPKHDTDRIDLALGYRFTRHLIQYSFGRRNELLQQGEQ